MAQKRNTTDLVKQVAKETGQSREVAKEIVMATLQAIASGLARGDHYIITNFGTFTPLERPARLARNPQTGGMVQVPAVVEPRFRSTGRLRKMVRDGDPAARIDRPGNRPKD